MPGLHIVHQYSGLPESFNVESRLDGLKHNPNYTARTLCREECTLVATTTYPDYPVAVFENDRFRVALDGRIYGLNDQQTESDLFALAGLAGDDSSNESAIGRWLLDHDGDYFIVAHDKQSGRWAALNDVFGRLSVYYRFDDSGLTISREYAFVADHVESPTFDRLAVAEHLLFGYPMGTLTFLKGVHRLPAGQMIRWSRESGSARCVQTHAFDLGDRDHKKRRRDFLHELLDLFKTGCRHRVDSERPALVTLSGGLDSRTVLAGLVEAGCRPVAMTHHEPRQTPQLEVDIARQVAAALGVEWSVMPLTAPSVADAQRLLSLKSGLNDLTMAYGLPFMREVRRRWTEGVGFFTGDGGDVIFRGLLRSVKVRDNDDVVDYITKRHQAMLPEQVTELTGVELDRVREHLVGRLSGYPEAEARYRFIHYWFFDRAVRGYFEGEDRNRADFWCLAPFYALPVFRLAMRCPDEWKRRNRFHCQFLKLLSPAAAGVVEANQGCLPGSFKYRARTGLVDLLARSPRLYRTVRRIRFKPSPLDPDSLVLGCLRKQLARGGAVAGLLSPHILSRHLDRPDGFTPVVWNRILTLTCAIERLAGEEGVLDGFEGRTFE